MRQTRLRRACWAGGRGLYRHRSRLCISLSMRNCYLSASAGYCLLRGEKLGVDVEVEVEVDNFTTRRKLQQLQSP